MFLCEKGAEELCHWRKNGRVKNQNKFNSWTTSVRIDSMPSQKKKQKQQQFLL